MRLPSDIEAEWGILGDVLASGGAGGQLLAADLFTDDGAIQIAAAMRGLIEVGSPVTVETVGRSCADRSLIGKLMGSGGGRC